MDSTSSSSTASGKNNLLVEQFCSITSSSRDEAYATLEVYRWDLLTAINMHANVKSENDANERKDSAIGDGLRFPIQPTRWASVEDNLSSYYELRSELKRKRIHHSVFEAIQDFDVEDPFQESCFRMSREPHRKRCKLDQPPLSDFESLDSDSESEDVLSKNNFVSAFDTFNFENLHISKIKDDKTDENWKDFLGPEIDPKTELMLCFPDGNRKQIALPCTTKIKSLLLYIGELGYGSEDYELIASYPRKNLNHLDLFKSLEEEELINREFVIVYHK